MPHRAPTFILQRAVIDPDATPDMATDPATADPAPPTLRSPGPPSSRPSSPPTRRALFGLLGEGVQRGV